MSSYSMLIIDSPYENYMRYFWEKYPEVKRIDYEGVYRALRDDSFIEWMGLLDELHSMGVESELVFYDQELQRRWKPEYWNRDKFDILCEQIRIIQPDVILLADMALLSENQWKIVNMILEPYKTKKIAWNFSSLNDKSQIRQYEMILTGSQRFADELRKIHNNVKYLPHAFSVALCDRFNREEIKNKVSFAGNFFLPIHGKRLMVCSELVRNGIDTVIAGDVLNSYRCNSPKKFIKRIIHPHKLSEYEKQLRDGEIRIEKFRRSGVFGLEYFKFIREHTVALNCHADLDLEEDSGNFRMFEATGMGSCLLTNASKGNRQFFEPDYEIMEYASIEECVEKARWLLDHPDKAREIALAGQKRTLQQYNYENQAHVLDEYIQELFR